MRRDETLLLSTQYKITLRNIAEAIIEVKKLPLQFYPNLIRFIDVNNGSTISGKSYVQKHVLENRCS